MTWTYSGDPSSSDRDLVRLLLGDTDSTAPVFTDEEIAATMTLHGSARWAAHYLALAAGAKYARRVDKSIDGLSLSSSQISQAFYDLAAQLKAQAIAGSLGGTAGVYAGGLSKTEKATDLADTNLPAARFRRDQFENTEQL